MISWQEQLGGHHRRLKILWDGKIAWALNVGSTERDFLLQRPTIHPFTTPNGIPVCEHSAHNRVHHKGIWIGHARINGVNCFHDGPTYGSIRLLSWQQRPWAAGLHLSLELAWLNEQNQPIAEETRHLRFQPAIPFGTGRAHQLELTSILRAPAGTPLHLGRDAHAYCGIRLLDLIDEEDGGLIRNSEGAQGEAEAMGQVARWVDATGLVGGQPAGVTLMVHPTSPPQAFFVRSYGTILANPTLHGDITLPPGEALVQRFAFLAHDGPGDPAAIEAAYAAWAADGRGPA